jgi:TonB family protein
VRILLAALLTALPCWGGSLPPGDDAQVQFRPPRDEEVSLRALVEAFASAWNAGDGAALAQLALTPADTRAVPPGDLPRLEEQLRTERGDGSWRMELEPEGLRLSILQPGRVLLRQPYRRLVAGAEAEAEVLEATAVKGSRGWRILEVKPRAQKWLSAHHLTGQIPEPTRTKHVPPRYPEDAKRARIQGVVTLECRITAQGKVAEVKVLHGTPELNDAAVEAVRQWEYAPTLLNGVAVPVTMTVTVSFKLS